MSDFVVEVNPELLVWARLNEGMSLTEAASRLSVSVDELRKLESGEVKTRKSFLDKCCKVYSRPFPVFLLERPPKEDRRSIVEVRLIYDDGSEREFSEG
jgi:transcriptional regulator with XRE-family HTH domain